MYEINETKKKIRKQKKITQEYIAKHLGITTRAYSKIESGKTNLTIEKLYKITDILNVNLLNLFEGDRVRKPNLTNEIILNNNNTISLLKHYEETITLLKEQNKLLKKLLDKKINQA